MNISNKKAMLSLLIVFCMVLPVLSPVLTYAEDYGTVLCVEDKEFYLSESPLQNDLGIMVSAKVLANAFYLDYSFDEENKAFEMYDDIHGKIVLMHNATVFYSGENIYKCAPFFYVSNGEPLVEIGFFCNMFMSSYTYDYENNKLVIERGTLADDVASVMYNGKETPLLVTPRETENGLETDLPGLAAALGIECKIDGDTAFLSNQDDETVRLKSGATTFTSTFGEFDCGSFFNIVNDIPVINIAFFCDLYGICYTYDKESKTVNLSDEMTMYEMCEEEQNAMTVNALSETYLSGSITYDQPAPKGGYTVKLILQQVGYRYSTYSGSSYYAGNSYILGSVYIPEGQTKSETNFLYDIGSCYSSYYSKYCLYFEESTYGHYGYYSTDGTHRTSWSPIEDCYLASGATRFSYTNRTANLNISTQRLSGNVSLPTDHVAPEGGLDVGIILQTRSSLYTDMYGDKYYNIGENYNAGEVRIPYLGNNSEFSFDITSLNLGESYYDDFSIFYYVGYNDCTPSCGYIDKYSNTKEATSIPSGYYGYYTNLKTFDTASSYSNVNITLPVYDDYTSDFANKTICYFTNGSTRAVINGKSVTLSNAPFKYSSYLYISVRDCASGIGATLTYDSATKTYTFKKGDKTISYKSTSTYCRTLDGVTYIRGYKVYNALLSDTDEMNYSSTELSVTSKRNCIEVTVNGERIPVVEAHPVEGTVVIGVYNAFRKLKEIRTIPASQMIDINFYDIDRGDYCKIMWWGNTIAPVTSLSEIDL